MTILSTLLVGTALANMLAPPFYSAKPVEATVVEAETGKPIPGALVIAQWVLEQEPGGDRVGTLRADEAITDSNGRFRIAGWGPIARSSGGALYGRDPELFVFKDSFAASVFSNEDDGSPRASLVERNSVWNGRSLQLKKRQEPERQHRRNFTIVYGRIGFLFGEDGCAWKALPKAMKVLQAERQRHLAAGANSSAIPSLDQQLAKRECGPFEEYLRKYEEFK